MTHKIIRVETKNTYSRVRCTRCLRYAANEEILTGLYPVCIKPARRVTRLGSILKLDYGSNAIYPAKPLWHRRCKEYLVGCGDGYVCGCPTQRNKRKRGQIFPLPDIDRVDRKAS